MKKLIFTTFFAFTALICSTAQAELVSYGNSAQGTFAGISAHEYAVIGPFSVEKNGQMKNEFDFHIYNVDTNSVVQDVVGRVYDTSSYDKSGNTQNGNSGFKGVSVVDGGLFFSHNTATQVTMDFGGDFFTSYGMSIAGHNAKDDWIKVIAYTSNDEKLELFQETTKKTPAFFGFSVDDGNFITKLVIEVWGYDKKNDSYYLNNKNGGFTMGEVFANGVRIQNPDTGSNSDPTSSTPEPATLFLFGLGVAALPIARRIRNK